MIVPDMVVGPRRTNDSPLSEAAKLKKALMRDGKVARQPFPGIARWISWEKELMIHG
jgi:hypothetical protein